TTKITIPSLPKRVTLRSLLKFGLVAMPSNNATWVVKADCLEITTILEAFQHTRAPVHAVFDQWRLADAVHELAAIHGATILIDPRVGSKQETPISATLANGTPLNTTIALLGEMAGLKTVALTDEGVLFLTTAENARKIRHERRVLERQEQSRLKEG